MQRQEEQSKKERTEQEQLELEQLMEWSSEGENEAATRKKSISGPKLFINSSFLTMTVSCPGTDDECHDVEIKSSPVTIRYKGVSTTAIAT